MMFLVKYLPRHLWERIGWRHVEFMKFAGEGAVHLLETGLVLEGVLPRVDYFQLPFQSFYMEIFGGHTIRTVPYSVIERYLESNGARRKHLLAWAGIGDREANHAVEFRLKSQQRNEEFSDRILEYMSVARSFK